MAKGKKMNPLWGAAIGTGAGTLTAVGIRQLVNPLTHPKLYGWSEGIGFVAGALPGAAMMFLGKGKYKDAGLTAIVSALVCNGVRQAEMFLMASKAQKAVAALPGANEGGMGGTVLEPATVLAGTELSPATALLGGYSEGQHGNFPQLVGANLDSANAHIQGMGGPALSAYASHWGSTHFSK